MQMQMNPIQSKQPPRSTSTNDSMTSTSRKYSPVKAEHTNAERPALLYRHRTHGAPGDVAGKGPSQTSPGARSLAHITYIDRGLDEAMEKATNEEARHMQRRGEGVPAFPVK